jgi:repressor LexA
VPYYGKIHAGEPAVIPENRSGFITMDRRFIPTEDVYFLKVKGDSMIGRAITDGDFVMVNPAARPKENDIVAARIGEEATIKTLSKNNGSIVLTPANPADREIEIKPSDDFGILGVVCGVFRPFVTMESQTAEMPKSS